MSSANLPESHSKSNVVTEDGSPVSPKVVQSLYNIFTGKSERLSKQLNGNHVIDIQDFRMLNQRMEQICDQYQIISKNVRVTVYYIDDSSDRFSSFDRFEIASAQGSVAVENIEIAYDFLIQLHGVSKPQQYEIRLNIHSRFGMDQKQQNKIEPAFAKIFRFVMDSTGYYSIKYIDYAVARSVKHVIDEWYNALPKREPSRVVKALQKFAPAIPETLRGAAVIGTMIIIITFWNFTDLFDDMRSLFNGIVVASGTLLLVNALGSSLGHAVSNHVMGLAPESGVLLNKGDEKAQQDFKLRVSRSLSRQGFALLGLVATWIASALVKELVVIFN